MKYRSKPVEVEAVQFNGDESVIKISNTFSISLRLWFFNDEILQMKHEYGRNKKTVLFKTDWIIKDGDNFSVCSDEEFRRKYEAIEK